MRRRRARSGYPVGRAALWTVAATFTLTATLVDTFAGDSNSGGPTPSRPLRRVLLLNQYRLSYPVNRVTSRAIRDVMSGAIDVDVQLFEEYIDQSRLRHQVGQVLAAVTARYKGTPFDFSSSPMACRWSAPLLERPQLFAGVPKVITTVERRSSRTMACRRT